MKQKSEGVSYELIVYFTLSAVCQLNSMVLWTSTIQDKLAKEAPVVIDTRNITTLKSTAREKKRSEL